MSYDIEVDNRRAEKAFKKGLDDLANVWPAIVAWCEKDAVRMQAWKDEIKAREETSIDYFRFRPDTYYYPNNYRLKGYEAQRQDLRNMHAIASIALGSYKMTFTEVLLLASCEDGSFVENILKGLV